MLTATNDYEQLNFTPDHGNSGKIYLIDVEIPGFNFRYLPHEIILERFLDARLLSSRFQSI